MGASSSKAYPEEPPPAPCKRLACDIQYCLAKNQNQTKPCQDVLERFDACVRKHASPEQAERLRVTQSK